MTDEELLKKKETLCEMIGDFSQDIYYCSYNDDTVLRSLLSGAMVDELKSADEQQRINLAKCGWNLDTFYQDMLNLVNELKVWGDGWYSWTAFKDMTGRYRKIIIDNKREDLFE